MFFETHNSADISIDGTCFRGYVTSDYSNIIRIFGEPIRNGDGYKVDAEWRIFFNDGLVATIYNWKNGKNYLGSDGEDVRDIKEWHIGGRNPVVVERVKNLLSDDWESLDYIRQRAILE